MIKSIAIIFLVTLFNIEQPKEKENAMSKEEKGTPSPFSKSTNPHPDPKRK